MNQKTKEFLKVFLAKISFIKKPLIFLSEVECKISSMWTASAHKRLGMVEFYIPERPFFFDQNINLFYGWRHGHNSCWLERGVYSSLAVKRGGRLLELCCGDGFFTRNCYSSIAKDVVAIDFDKSAIKTAKRKNSSPNIEYVLADIRTGMPDEEFDNIVWDASLQYFTQDEINDIMERIKKKLSNKNGIFSGYVTSSKIVKEKWHKVKNSFSNLNDLKDFFALYFKNVIVFETIYPDRQGFYFWASDSDIPFLENWAHWAHT